MCKDSEENLQQFAELGWEYIETDGERCEGMMWTVSIATPTMHKQMPGSAGMASILCEKPGICERREMLKLWAGRRKCCGSIRYTYGLADNVGG